MTKSVSLNCPECGKPMKLKSGRYGRFYGCIDWPDCSGSHCAHQDGSPMGIPANQETKQARRAAHAAFDEIRATFQFSRKQAYKWLQEALNMTPDECHMGRFDKATCEHVIEICNQAITASGVAGKQ